MKLNPFDSKFGDSFLSTLPLTPGVYKIFNAQNVLVYVGKAKNIRRRLSQYRNAKRRKIHRKMKSIVNAAARIEITNCQSDAEALRLELKLIQTHRPALNVSNAFDFMYPMIGLKFENKKLSLVVTTLPESFSNFSFHGCFRSRTITRQAFQSLGRILYFFGKLKRNRSNKAPYSSCIDIEDLDPVWMPRIEAFFDGKLSIAARRFLFGDAREIRSHAKALAGASGHRSS